MNFSKVVLPGVLALSILAPIASVSASPDPSTAPAIIVTKDAGNLTEEQKQVLQAFSEVTAQISTNSKISDEASVAADPVYWSQFKLSRGSALAWSDAIVDWGYNYSQVTASSAHQESGYIFPNIVKTRGVTKQTSSVASYHNYLSLTTIGAGVVTPWGDVTVYESDFSDYIRVYKDGSGTNY